MSESDKKRQRVDTAQGAVNAMESAATEILPPDHCNLRPGDMPFWRSIVKARDAKLWTDADLENAANLARAKADIERIQKELDKEGDVIINARGTPVVNPRHQVLETLSRKCMAISRMLHIHAEATSGKARDEKPRNKAAKDAQVILSNLDDDDLIARPH